MIEPSSAPDPPSGLPDPPRDWFQFWVRFFFGAVFGLAVGLWLWFRVWPLSQIGWIALPAASVIFALVAAHYGDRFWESLRQLWWF
jgi:hypothetical protein